MEEYQIAASFFFKYSLYNLFEVDEDELVHLSEYLYVIGDVA